MPPDSKDTVTYCEKQFLTYKSGQNEHTWSRADKGRNQWDKDQPLRHTGHLATKKKWNI